MRSRPIVEQAFYARGGDVKLTAKARLHDGSLESTQPDATMAPHAASSPSTRALPPVTRTAFGRVLRRMRKAREMTRAELAAKVGVSPGYVRAVEKGRTVPSPAAFAKLAEGLGVSLVVALAFLRGAGD
jgi:ribosome-binding protein aMBF1 (putative translation factor)